MRTHLPRVALVVTLAACSNPSLDSLPTAAPAPSASDDPAIPKPIVPGPLASPAPSGSSAAEVRGLTGPRPGAAIGVDVYRKRRRALMDKLLTKDHKPSAALVAGDMSFDGLREGMDVYYLTGVDEPGAAVLLEPGAPLFKEQLVLAHLDVEMDRYEGDRVLLPSRPLEVATGFAKIWRARSLPSLLLEACDQSGSLAFVQQLVAEPRPKPKAQELYGKTLDRAYGCQVDDLHGLLARMREVKAPEEIALMRKALEYTAAGHRAAWSAVHAGAREFEVKDAVEEAFRKAGSRHVAYDSIVGSGGNAAVLHYPKDDRVMQDGEVVLIDAAAEAEYYAADVTRTLPVSGKFTPDQRDIYDIVLRAQQAGIAAARAGARLEDVDQATRKVIADAGYYDQYVHFCCHFVGLEVHDVGEAARPLPAGAVITVEPGIYLPQRGFGVRIEDEVLITDGGAEVLSAAIPKDADVIEAKMADARGGRRP